MNFSREAEELARMQFSFNENSARTAREYAACQARSKAAAELHAVETALQQVLHLGLREFPDVFAGTRLTPSNVADVAAQVAALIA